MTRRNFTLSLAGGLAGLGAARADVSSFAAIDDAIVWQGKVFFFRGGEYVRYDMAADRADPGYPKPLRGVWGLPEAFFGGIDACVMGAGSIAYLFKGSQYIRYDLATDRTDGVARPIAGNWPGLSGAFATGIDAGFRWQDKAYLFRGGQYVRYDMNADRADSGYPLPIAGFWPGLPLDFALGIDAAVPWSDTVVYLFKGRQYVRFNMAANRADAGYPLAIADHWPGLGRPVAGAASPVGNADALMRTALTAYFAAIRANVALGIHAVPSVAVVAVPLAAVRAADPLAAIQLSAVFAELADLARSSESSAQRNTNIPADARRACGIGSGEWCGAFAARAYQPEGLAAPWRYQFQGTFGLRAYGGYIKAVDPSPANKPTHVALPTGRVPIKDYHTQRGSLRRMTSGTALQSALGSGAADVRPGDILIVRGAAAGAEHIQMVLLWDSASRLLYTIDGNGGSYEWDRRIALQHAAYRDPLGGAAERQRAGLEALSGVPVWRKPEGGGHVGIGVRNMADAAERGNILAAIRPSAVDFENLSYVSL